MRLTCSNLALRRTTGRARRPDPKSSPSRERFRPPSRRTVRFRVVLLGGLRPTGAPCSAQAALYAIPAMSSKGAFERVLCKLQTRRSADPALPVPVGAETALLVGLQLELVGLGETRCDEYRQIVVREATEVALLRLGRRLERPRTYAAAARSARGDPDLAAVRPYGLLGTGCHGETHRVQFRLTAQVWAEREAE